MAPFRPRVSFLPPQHWQARHYDFNVWTDRKRIEKQRHNRRNPITRGLAARPEDWQWSSFLRYATGAEGVVEIESERTAHRRERMGLRLKMRRVPAVYFPP
jgi:putative transposase